MKKITLLILLCFSSSCFISAQNSCLWAYIPIGSNNYGHTIFNSTIDLDGNIIQLGKIINTADMDPSAALNGVSYSNNGSNYFLSKTNSNGNLIWINYFIPPATGFNTFDGKGLAVNSNNEIVILANYIGKYDFDCSLAGVDTFRSKHATYADYVVAKYNTNGDYLWAKSIGSSGQHNIVSHALSIQSNNNILVAARPTGLSIDVDPSANVVNSIGSNANLICYSNDGQFVWINTALSTTAGLTSIKCLDNDAAQNIYMMTVSYNELTVNKFNHNGVRVWNKKIGNFSTGSSAIPYSLLTEKSTGAFYIAGTYKSTVDFDPNAVVFNKTSSSGQNQDAFIAKYDSSMNLIWVKTYAGIAIFGNYALDYSGNDIIAVGRLSGSIDFGNGNILSSGSTTNHPFLIKLNSMGNTISGYTIGGSGGYNSVNSFDSQSYHTTGYIVSTTDVDPTSNIVMLTTSSTNYFNAVYGTPEKILNLKLFLEGYYNGNGIMNTCLYNQGVIAPLDATDSIQICLHQSTPPHNVFQTQKKILQTNGMVQCNFTSNISGSYYISVNHRNHIETWSANPKLFQTHTSYDFSTNASQAYGSNQVEVGPNTFAIYSGDITQDGLIDNSDYTLWESDANSFNSGYLSTDLNADGGVDNGDYIFWEVNSINFVGVIKP